MVARADDVEPHQAAATCYATRFLTWRVQCLNSLQAGSAEGRRRRAERAGTRDRGPDKRRSLHPQSLTVLELFLGNARRISLIGWNSSHTCAASHYGCSGAVAFRQMASHCPSRLRP